MDDTPVDDEDFDQSDNDGDSDSSPEDESVEEFELNELETPDFYDNLVESLPLDEESKLATKYLDLIETDKDAVKERQKLYADGIKRTGLSGDYIGGADFDGASKAVHPGLAEACIDFQARAIKELMPPSGPVNVDIEGDDVDEEALDKAERKKRHMNWQLTKQIKEFRRVLEQTLAQVPLAGDAFIRFYPDTARGRPSCEYVRGDMVYLPYAAAAFETAQRITVEERLTEYEFERRVNSGLYRDVDLAVSMKNPEDNLVQVQMDKVEGKSNNNYDDENTRRVYNVYAFEHLESDKQNQSSIAPYIIAIDDSTRKILSIYRNWEEGDEHQERMDWLVPFDFLVFDGPRGLGLAHVIGTLSGAATGSLRALLDSAHIQNSQTLVVLKGGKIGGQSKRIRQGTMVELQSMPGVDDIRKVMQPLPFNPPSQVLFALLQWIDGQMRGIVRTTMDDSSDQNQNMPVGTKLANIEQGLIVYSSIHQRLHASMNKVLDILHRMNRMYMGDEEIKDGFATRKDYEGAIDVVPVSDPNIFSDVQRYQQLQGVMQLAAQAPQLYDMKAIHKRMLTQMKVTYIDEIMPDGSSHDDENPGAENIKMAMGAPAIAFPDQDHFAHLQTHLDFMKDPQYGASPLFAGTYLPLAITHIKQHLLFLYGQKLKERVEAAAGDDFANLKDKDPKVREHISQAVAAASPLVMEEMKQMLAGVDPVIMAALQQLQKMQPPPPVDPTQVQAQLGSQQIQVQQEKNQTDAQIKQRQLQQKQQEDAKRDDLAAQKLAVDQQKIRADILKNEEDNQTAKEISAMRIATGNSPGNLKDGSSFGNGYSEGGLVMAPDDDPNPIGDYNG